MALPISRPRRAEIRDAARALLDEIGVEALHAKLTERDPLTASRLRPTDPQRVLRAFEVFEATGRPLAEWQKRARRTRSERQKDRAPLCWTRRAPSCAPASPPRFEAMVEQGGLEEARTLEGLDPALPAAKLLGLRPLQALAAGKLDQGSGAGCRHHRDAAICQAPDDVVSPPDATLYLV